MKYRDFVLPCIAMFMCAATPAFAGDQDRDHGQGCHAVNGNIFEVQIATLTGEPRVLGPTTGALKGGNSSALKVETLRIGPGGVITADTVDTFVTASGDMLVANGHATFTPIPGEAPGEVIDNLTLEIDGAHSTGEFAGTTGTIQVTGVGHQFPPNPAFGGPGKTSFELRYSGAICKP